MAKRKQALGDPTVAVAYLRVSTDDQRNGPEAQRADIERWASRHGVRVVAWFEDHVSGGKGLTADDALDLTQRPGLLAAVAAVSEHRAGFLLVQQRDRLARDVLLAGMLDRLVSRAGAQLVSAIGAGSEPRRAGDDSGDDDDMKVFEDMYAQRERRKIRRRTKAALAVKSARGERVGTVPYGFQLAADGVKLEPRADEQAVLGRIAELQAAGVKQCDIVRTLAAAGVVGRTGKPLAQPQVHRLLGRSALLNASTVAA